MRKVKGKLKRFFAGVLAVCMLIAVMPSIYATPTAPQDLYFNFLKLCLRRENGFNTTEAVAQNNKGIDITTVTDLAMTTKGSATEINKNADNYGTIKGSTDPWCYVGKSATATMNFVSWDYAMQFNGAVGDWASIKVNVPADGKYEANSVSGYWEHSPIVRIYLAPENAANPRDAMYALNSIDAYAAAGAEKFNIDVPLATVDLTAGNYIVTYEMLGKNANAKNTKFCVSGFKLKGVTEMPTLSVGGEDVEIEENKSCDVDISANWSNGIKWDMYGAEFTAVSRNTGIANAEVISGLTGKKVRVTGIANGETVIDLTLKQDGQQLATGTMKVKVVAGELEPINLNYNFLKLCLRRENGFNTPEGIANANKGIDVTTVTDLTMTTKGSATEINKNADNYGVPTGATDPWCYVGVGNGGSFKFVSYDYAMQVRGSVGSWAAIKVKVPRDGLYSAYSVHGYWKNSPQIRFYIAPEDAANPRDAKYAVSSIDAYPTKDGKDVFNVETPIGNVNLTRGNYIVSYEIIGKNASAGNTVFCVQAFRLKQLTQAPTLTVTASDVEAPIGADTYAPLNAVWSDGAVDDLYSADIIAAAENSEIIDVASENLAEGKKIKLAGKLNGTTKINVTVKRNGNTLASCSFNAEVTGTPPKQYLNLNYNFLKLSLRREYGFNTTEAIANANKGTDITTVTDFAMTTKGDPAEINKNADLYGPTTGATDPWHFVGLTGGATFNFVSWDYAMQVGGNVGGRAQIKIKVPKDGIYTAYSVHGYWAYSSVMKIYLAPEDAQNPTAEEYILNAEDTYVPAPQQKFNIEVPYKTVNLKAGNYIVTYETAGQNELSAGTRFCVQAFRLKEVDELATISDFVADAVPTQPIGAQVESKLHATMSDGSVNLLTGMTVEAEVENPQIAEVEVGDNDFNLGKKLKITTLSAGKTNIKVTVKNAGEVYATYTLPLTVSDGNSPVKSISLTLRKSNVAVGKFTTATVIATLEDGLVKTLANNEIVFSSKNTDVATISPDGIVTAVKEGKTDIIANYNGVTATASVTVIPREIIFNYLKLDYRKGSGEDKPGLHNTGVPLGSVISFDMTTEGHDNEVNPSSVYSTEPWHYVGTDKATFNFVSSEYALQIRASSPGGWGALKIRVPFDGLYQAISSEGYWAHSPIVRYYLAPADAENPIDPKYSIGITDTYVPAAEQKFDIECPLDIVDIKAGDYILTYQLVGKNTDALNYYYCVTSFKLEPVKEMPTFTLVSEEPSPANPGIATEIKVKAIGSNGATDALYDAEIRAEISDPTVAAVSVNDANISDLSRKITVIGKKPGNAKVKIYVNRDGQELDPITVDIRIKTPVLAAMEAEMERTHLNLNRDPVQIVILAKDIDGDPINVPYDNCVFTSSNESVATVDKNGIVTPHSEGRSEIGVTVTLDGKTLTDSISITAGRSKIASTYYTKEKRAAALKNAQTYTWGRTLRTEAVNKADKYVDLADKLWNMVPGEGLPRSITVGLENDPDAYTCRYCKVDIRAKYGAYAWRTDAINDPWKVKCPECRRRFPSNDFAGFYQLGLDENGIFNYNLAHKRNQELVDAGQDGYLKNILYPEAEKDFGDANWGVDDGMGYKAGRNYSNGVPEVHTYIAYYMHYGLWRKDSYGAGGTLIEAVTSLRDAYLYTGDPKYGRTGIILLDRIADLWPDYSLMQYFKVYSNSHGGTGEGKIIGREWEAMTTAPDFALAYDAFYPIYEDEQVINFLSKKAEQYNLKNKKTSAELIRRNAEDGILREIFRAVKKADIHGNFGVHQNTLSIAAVVLDSMPETGEMIDWIMQSGAKTTGKNTGGDMLRTYIDLVDRDGQGNESASGYNRIWMNSTITVAETLANCKGYEAADLFANPKVQKMMTSFAESTLLGQGQPSIGDAGLSAGKYGQQLDRDEMVKLYIYTGNPDYARLAWYLNGNSAKDICQDIFVTDPNELSNKIEKEVETYGEWDFDKSSLMSGYGFVALRDGKSYNNAGNEKWDSQRDFWMYFGGAATSHKHLDGLNLGIDAYGVNLAPDLGYPEATGTNPNRHQWISTTLSHNTVLVNETEQKRNAESGFPLHYDDGDRVKLVDVSLPEVYDSVDEYRRTLVMVDVNGEVSYGIDFFRVTGGQDHLYSFHATSNEVSECTGFTAVTQAGGSYAGVNVPWGEDPYTVSTSTTVPLKFPKGYTWLKNVRRADDPQTGEFAVDFKIMNFKNSFPRDMDLHLRMTMLNDFNLSEITLADGVPPRTGANPDSLTYVLARRKGANLDTLFTTVYEPYISERYISSMENIALETIEGSGKAKAVKVTHVDGRVDYVIYSENNKVLYKITDGDTEFYFRGFLGVYTVSNGVPVYRYLNDGDVLGARDDISRGEINGIVCDFSRDLVFDNTIVAEIQDEITAEDIIGRHVYVTNDGAENAVYPIENAEKGKGKFWILHLGNHTLIRQLKDSQNVNGGYIFNIEQDQELRIPVSMEESMGVVVEQPEEINASAGHKISYTIKAKSNIGKKITYADSFLPRGASLTEDGTVIWTPDNQQIGEYIIAVTVSDDTVDDIVYIPIKVFKSAGSATDGSSSNNQGTQSGSQTPSGDGSGSGGGASGGGGGSSSDTSDNDNTEDNGNTDVGAGVPDGPNTPTKKFVDLGNHAWAEDAIYALVEKGVVNGTSVNTYAPAANIKRADFAIMLVRAFGVTEGEAEHFADVDASKYYAEELAIAKANGIVGGIGDNKFNPEGEITRQDMILMLTRALDAVEYELSEADKSVLAQFTDAAQISDYAADAVSRVVRDGVITGANGRINPLAKATRAEVAVMLERVLAK